jgi:hypothetical protein
MPSITGSSKITKHTAMPLNDQPKHEMGIAEVTGTQKSADPLWNNSKIQYNRLARRQRFAARLLQQRSHR